MSTVPAYTVNGITRPALTLDDTGHIILTPDASAFAAMYGLQALYLGLPANTPYPPVTDSVTTPVDTNGATNTVAEGAAVNTAVGITVSATAGMTITYSLTADSSGGGFKIDPNTGVVTVANPAKIDFETAAGHTYNITVQANDGVLTSSQSFAIGVTNVAPTTPVDSNGAANAVAEGAAAGTLVGITASSTDVNGPGVTWTLSGDSSGGGFKIDAHTGVITVADSTKIDYETSAGHAYTVTATASDGTASSSQNFTINVTDVPLTNPVDNNAAANTVLEGAAAGTTVGLTAFATDPNGPTTTYSLIGDTSAGGFTINATTGVVSVANSSKIDYESAPGHSYNVTVQASNGAATTQQTFAIGVGDVAPSAPTDSNAGANTVLEGAANGTAVGITASATDINGGAVTYSLTGDSSNGGFTINATTGVVTVADSTKIDYETAPGHAYTVTAQASDGTLTNSQTFTIAVSDVAPSTPVDSNAGANNIDEGAATGTTVGITASSSDVNGPAVTYSKTGDTSNGGFTVNATTGVVTVLDGTKIDYETSPGHAYSITVQASDGTLTSSQTFTIAVNDLPPNLAPDGTADNSVVEGAANGTAVGVTIAGTDPGGGLVTYSLVNNPGGAFAIDSATGVITVADSTKFDYESSAGTGHTISGTARASDASGAHSDQIFTIQITDAAPSTPIDSDGGANTVFEGTANGTTVGIIASSTDVNGPAVTYSLTDDAGGRFTINTNTGVVTVANGAAIDYETAPGHAYSVIAQASDGTLTSAQTFTIGVANVNEAPAGTDNTVTTLEGNAYVFAAADFGFTDPSDSSSPNSLLAVKITTLPGGGVLTDNGNPVAAGGFVSVTDINNGLLVFTPTAHANGAPEATFTFQVQDNGGTANGGVDLDQSPNTMLINVSAVNDAPVNSVPGPQSVSEDANLVFSTGNGNAITISDIDVGSGNETVTLSVASGTLTLGSTLNLASFANDGTNTVTLTGTVANVNAALNGLSYHGNLDFNGSDSLSVVTSDNGNTGVGGPLTDTDSIAITVNAVNDAPVNAVPAAQTALEDSNLVFSAATSNAITISDVDANGGNETVTLTVASGTLALGSTLGLVSFAGNNTQIVTLTGTVANINTALDGLTYHGNLNFNGSDSLTITTNDNGNTGAGGALTDSDSVGITVTPVNDAPAGTDKAIAAVGAHTFVASDFGFTDPADAAGGSGANNFAAVIITTLPGSGTLTDSGNPVNPGDTISIADINAGFLVFTPTGNSNASFTFQVKDDGLTANGGVDTDQSPNTFTINQNFPPAIDSNGGGDTAAVSAAENQTTVTTVHATDPDNGPSPVTYTIVGGDDAAKFTLDLNTGALKFITAPDFENPTDTSTAGTNTYIVTVQASDGVAVDSQTITITVTDANDAPVITSNGAGATASVNVNENSTAVTQVTATDQDLPAQVLSYSIVGGADQAKFTIDATGHLSFVTAPNFEAPTDTGADNGYDVIVRVTDNGAPNLHDDQAITVHVQDVNEAPDTGAITTTGLEDATSIALTITGNDVDAGDSVASFHITNIPNAGTQGTLYSDAGLTHVISNGTDVTATGNAATVYFVPNANYNTHAGAVTFNAASTDTHGLTDATPATETINVTAVNDAPVNNGVPANFVVESGFSHAITGLSISDIDANEVSTPTDITTVLSAGAGTVAIGNGASGGTAGIAGGATITTNGSSSVTLTGSITQINTTLSASNGVVYTAADNAGNTVANSSTTITMTTNDHGHNGTGGSLTDTDTIQVGVLPQVWFIDQAQTSLDATAPRGSQTNPFTDVHEFNTSSGPGTNDYIYVKAGTYTGEGINLKDGQTLLGDDQALSFANPLGGSPIVIETASGARPTINVTTASDQGIALASGNTISGINVTTGIASAIGIDDGEGASGHSVGTLTITNMAISGLGEAVDIDHGGSLNITLDSASSTGGTYGIQLGTSAGGTALTGTFNGGTGAISGSSTAGFAVGGGGANTGGTAVISYGGTITAANTANNVNIQSHSTGAVTLSGNLTHTGTGNAIVLDSNSSNVTFSGTTDNLTTGNANAIQIASQTGGTVGFSGTVNIDTTTGAGVNLNGNTGGTVNFTGGSMTIDTSGGNGFVATGGGTVNVTGTGNHINSGSGTALNIANTTIGSSNVTFHDISASGGTNGIVLNNTGSSGHLAVTGTGTTAGSGGTISNMTGGDILTGSDASGQTVSGTGGTGIFLQNTNGATFSNVALHDFSNFAIYGNNVTGFNLDHSTISGVNGTTNAGDREEGSIRFDNLLGTATISNNSISGGFDENIDLYNTSGTLSRLTMDSNAFGLIGSTGNDNVRGQLFNSATANFTLTNSTFAGTRADFIAFAANNNATMDVVVRGNTFHNGQAIVPGGGTAVDVRSGSGGLNSAAHTTFDISHNTLTDGGANAFDTVGIFVAKGQDNGTLSGTIASNAIGPAKVNSNSDGIFVRDAGTGTLTTLIQNNTVTGVGNNGIHLQNNDGSATLNATLYGNSVSSPTSSFPFAAFFVDNGATATDTSTTNILVGMGTGGTGTKNTFNHSALYNGGATDVELSNFNGNTHLNLSLNGSAVDTVQNVIRNDNTSTTGNINVDTSGGNGTTTLVNTAPALPAVVAPLLAAPGGVQASTPTAGETHLTQAELDTIVTAAIAQWMHAGATPAQLAAMLATNFSVADLNGAIVGEQSPGHIVIDTDADGHGWFIDTTPNDNSEFTHAVNGTSTDFLTDPTNAAAGHLDLLTTVVHELGHVLGLPDVYSPTTDLMYINLTDGERRLVDHSDVTAALAALPDPTAPITPAVALGFAASAHSNFAGTAKDGVVMINADGSAAISDSTGSHSIAGAGTVANGWHFAGTGDFDGNGTGDILWVNGNGKISVWDNGQISGAHIVADVGADMKGWHFAGTGDFDGNGKSDILWVNDNGSASIWDNGQLAGAHVIAPAGTVANGWHFAGTGDFDGNHQSDIAWVNDNGKISVWDNGQISGAHIVADVGAQIQGWHFTGTGDFDGNGKSDFLWVNDNGMASIWDNGQLSGAHGIAPAGTVANGWHFATTADVDGNGKSDIVWQNDNGAISVWDNGQIAGAHIVTNPGVAAAGWHIV